MLERRGSCKESARHSCQGRVQKKLGARLDAALSKLEKALLDCLASAAWRALRDLTNPGAGDGSQFGPQT